ncbi:MAG: Na+ dependent nucleoside transporter [Opitutae bacterium]|jgi:CNT family concentrative nucleoside transporter|nr:Na+ dependent nucleoside transporter [Opitutae bacterium]HBJ61530.1 Na+ dependent nucleoside transporter [Opitutae bacterium]|tara:strand:+ start:145 stop:1488 length:1344 start_codon:yes stop_codon:yes gene_type:complete
MLILADASPPTGSFIRAVIGVVGLLALAYFFSEDRKKVNWRVVGGGLALQCAIALGVLRLSWIEAFFGWIAGLFATALDISVQAAGFVFGPLSDIVTMNAAFEGRGFVFAFMALPSILFFSALSSLLYYFGILQLVVRGMAWVMSRVMRLSGAESLAAAANVFVGQTEAPLLVKPYVPKLTRSELLALMVGGMATIAGSVFAIYMGMLGGSDEQSKLEFGKFLLCASAMNAPAALLMAKVLVPEREEVSQDLTVSRESIGRNPIDALANGTTQGLQLALNVAAMLIAFYAVIMLVNEMLAFVGGIALFGDANLNQWIQESSGERFDALSLQALFGFLFAPIAWLIGVSSHEILQVGQLIGTKIFATEFFAYAELAGMKEEGLSSHSVFLSTFALCGFANFMSIGIQIGGIGALAPDRRGDLASLGVKALFGGTMASLLSATIAGSLF